MPLSKIFAVLCATAAGVAIAAHGAEIVDGVEMLPSAFASATIQPSTSNSQLPSRHVPKRVMGRDYWPALYKYRDWLPGAKYDNSVFEVRFDNPEIFKLPAFRDAVPVYWARNDPDCGADVLAVETTNSSGGPTSDTEYRWNLAPMFVRGAAV